MTALNDETDGRSMADRLDARDAQIERLEAEVRGFDAVLGEFRAVEEPLLEGSGRDLLDVPQ